MTDNIFLKYLLENIKFSQISSIYADDYRNEFSIQRFDPFFLKNEFELIFLQQVKKFNEVLKICG